jgi:hypothetical protein
MLMAQMLNKYKSEKANSHKQIQSGLRMLPPPVLAPKTDLTKATESFIECIEAVPTSWAVEDRIANARFQYSELDRTFGLFNVVKNKTEMELEMGRIWSSKFRGQFEVRPGDRWGDVNIGLEPVFAGLTEEAFDRTAAAALQNLPYAFSGSRASDFSAKGRHAVRDLAMRPFNATRYLMRLAVLHCAAMLVESCGDELEATVDGNSSDIKWVGTTGVLNGVVIEAVRQGTQFIYYEAGEAMVEEVPHGFLLLTAAEKITCSCRNRNTPMPDILGLWPEIPNAQLLLYGSGGTPAANATITTGMTWGAIEQFVGQYGLYAEWNEIFTTVTTLSMRPRGSTIFCGLEKLSIAMPGARMEAAALGPLSAPVRMWDKERLPMNLPQPAAVFWEGTSRYMAWELGWQSVLYSEGISATVLGHLTNTHVKFITSLMTRGGNSNGFQNIVENYMGDMGWHNGLGRILRSAVPSAKNRMITPHILMQALVDPHTIQWEEALVHVEKIPPFAAIHSTLYPAYATELVAPRLWLSPTAVLNRLSTDDAIFTAFRDADLSVALEIQDVQQRSIQQLNAVVANTWRGEPKDGSFSAPTYVEGCSMGFVLRANNSRGVLRLMYENKRKAEGVWLCDTTRLVDGFMVDDALVGPSNGKPYSGDKASGDSGDAAATDPSDPSDKKPTPPGSSLGDAGYQTPQPPAPQGKTKEEELGHSEYGRLLPPFKVDRSASNIVLKEEEVLTPAFRYKFDQIKNALKETPSWMVALESHLKKTTKPTTASRSSSEVIFDLRNELKDTYGANVIMALKSPASAPSTLRNIAWMLEKAAEAAQGDKMQIEILQRAQQTRLQAGAIEASGGIASYKQFQALTGKKAQPFMTDELFAAGLISGMSVGELVNYPNKEEVIKKINSVNEYLEKTIFPSAPQATVIDGEKKQSTEREEIESVWEAATSPLKISMTINKNKGEASGSKGTSGTVSEPTKEPPDIPPASSSPIITAAMSTPITPLAPTAAQQVFGGEPSSLVGQGGLQIPVPPQSHAESAPGTLQPAQQMLFGAQELPGGSSSSAE